MVSKDFMEVLNLTWASQDRLHPVRCTEVHSVLGGWQRACVSTHGRTGWDVARTVIINGCPHVSCEKA